MGKTKGEIINHKSHIRILYSTLNILSLLVKENYVSFVFNN